MVTKNVKTCPLRCLHKRVYLLLKAVIKKVFVTNYFTLSSACIHKTERIKSHSKNKPKNKKQTFHLPHSKLMWKHNSKLFSQKQFFIFKLF